MSNENEAEPEVVTTEGQAPRRTKPARMPTVRRGDAEAMVLRSSNVDSMLPTLMAAAVEQGPEGVTVLQELVKLKQQVDREEARKAWFAAVARFQGECPELFKSKQGRFGPYAPLGRTLALARPHLAPNGLSATWVTRRYPDDPMPYKVCRLAHKLGHIEESECPIIVDEAAGRRADGVDTLNAMQRYGIADSYAERYSFEAVAGLAGIDDEDGSPAASAGPPEPRRKSAGKPAEPKPAEEPPHPAEQSRSGKPVPRPNENARGERARIEVVEVTERSGTTARGPWTKYTATDADGNRYDTFSDSFGVVLKAAAGTHELLDVLWAPPEREGYGRRILDILEPEAAS
jgi:hypothetical protein